MSQAYYDEASRPSRSFLDRLVDRAPTALRSPAEALALASDKTATAYEQARTAVGPRLTPVLSHVRKRRVPYALAALAIGIGVGVLLHRPTRQRAGALAGKAWDGARDSFSDQLGRELQSLFRR
jgi:hypothetical protein